MLKRIPTLLFLVMAASLALAQEVVTTNRSTPLYERPDANSPSTVTLPAGLQLSQLREEGDWVLVSTSNMTIGWVPRDAIGSRQPEPPPMPPEPANEPPQAADRIPDMSLVFNRDTYSRNLVEIFADPDGDPLQFRVSTENPQIAVAYIEGTFLHVLPGSTAGQTTVNVYADDPAGLSARLSFAVTAEPQPSVILQQPPADEAETEPDLDIAAPEGKKGKGWVKWALIGGGLVAGGVAAAVLLGGGGDGGDGDGTQLPFPPPLPTSN
jgi:hypothetical protein